MPRSEIPQTDIDTANTVVPASHSGVASTNGTLHGMAATVIGTHAITHIYTTGFYVILPMIYNQFGLVPVQAGIIDAARWFASGVGGMLSGFLVDMYRHRRGFFLGLSLLMLATGYLMVSVVPSYELILLAFFLAHIGVSIWHPPGIGLLSEHYPKRRGLMISLHRSSGSIGDTAGPVLVGGVLVSITWQQTLQFGFPIAVILSAALWFVLRNVESTGPAVINIQSDAARQWSQLKTIARVSSMIPLLIIAALRGMGDRAVMLFLPLYLANVIHFTTVKIGFYLGLLSALAIVSGPVIGIISDRIGRKPMIVIALFASAIVPPVMVLSGDSIWLTVSVALFGLFLNSVNSLVQAAAMDIAEGMKLEGSLLGMLWGNNALFGAISPVIAGLLVGLWGYGAAFYYAGGIYLIAGILAALISLGKIQESIN